MSTRVAEKHLRRRREMVDAAIELVAESGLGGLSISQVAAALNLRAPSLYWYFPSREDLVVSVQLDVMQAIAERLGGAEQEGFAPTGGSAAESALRHIASLVDAFLTLPRSHTLVVAESAMPRRWLSDEAVAQVLPSVIALLDFPGRAIARAEQAGALSPGDPRERAAVLWSQVQGALGVEKYVGVPDAHVPSHAIAWSGVRALLLGWGASREQVDAALRRAD